VRPKINIATEGLEKSLKSHIVNALSDKGVIAESELWDEALSFFSPNIDNLTSSLVKNYKLMFGRKIGQKTAKTSIVNNLRLMLSKIKKDMMHTQKQVILGRRRFGRIFYSKGSEGKIQSKVNELVEKKGGHAKNVLKESENGPVKITPVNRRAVEMLEYYGLVETRNIGSPHAVKPGYREVKVNARESAGNFPKHFRIYKPFSIQTWALKDGPEKISIHFDVAAWDPVNRIFYLGLEKEYVGLNDAKAFREKITLLGLAAKPVIYCKNISEGASSFCRGWGIDISKSE
jgi:hypothetical protein